MAEEKTETRVDGWPLDAACEIADSHNDVLLKDAKIIAKHHEKWLASHAVSAPSGNLVKLAIRVVSTRDAWWKHDKPPDSQERDDFLGAIADLTEAVLHAPPRPAASVPESRTEKE